MAFNNGWNVLDSGKAEILNAAPADTEPVINGCRYTSDGKRYGIAYAGSLAAGSGYVNGTAHSPDGRMYYVTSLPSPASLINGIVHNSAGAMYVQDADPQAYLAGFGVRNDGALCVVIT